MESPKIVYTLIVESNTRPKLLFEVKGNVKDGFVLNSQEVNEVIMELAEVIKDKFDKKVRDKLNDY